MTDEKLVLGSRQGSLGVITLNRPRAVNALNLDMMQLVDQLLTEFEADDSVTTVLMTGAGDRGLCAGGDVKSIYYEPERMPEFMGFEYTMNLRLSRYPKPLVSFMDGLVLGGGVGISAHAAYRVVTERSRVGMPETIIGFSPDVGALHILSRSPRKLGYAMALTGLHASGADALAVGLADYYVPSERLNDLAEALSKVDAAENVERCIQGFTVDAGPSRLEENADWIERAFSGTTVEKIVAEVERQAVAGADEGPLVHEVLAALRHNSPTGMKVALEATRRAADQTLNLTLNQDYAVTLNSAAGHDMREGIRAQVIDKDRQPAWQPATLEEVDEASVLAFFEDPESGPLELRSV